MSTPASDNFVGFDAESAVSDFSYRIPEKWGGDNRKHSIPEPSSEQVARFWSDIVAQAALSPRPTRMTDDEREKETDEARDARLREEIIAGEHRSLETISERRRIIAALCSDDPNEEQLKQLPHRLLNAFEAYIMRAISPEAEGAATTS